MELNSRLKTAIVIIPGCLFFAFGFNTWSNVPGILSSTIDLAGQANASMIPILCYGLSLIVECATSSMNVRDATSEGLKSKGNLLTTFKKIPSLLKVKDPVLKAI